MKSKHLFLVVLTFMASVFVDRADAAVFTVFAAVHSVGCNQVLNTGISVTPNPPGTAGLMLSINADRNDLWKNDPTPPWFSNADGLGNPFGPSLGTLTVTPTGGSSFSFLFGSLVGSLDGGLTFFPVGTRMEMTILNTGKLSLYYWDIDCANNSGFVRVSVHTYNGPS